MNVNDNIVNIIFDNVEDTIVALNEEDGLDIILEKDDISCEIKSSPNVDYDLHSDPNIDCYIQKDSDLEINITPIISTVSGISDCKTAIIELQDRINVAQNTADGANVKIAEEEQARKVAIAEEEQARKVAIAGNYTVLEEKMFKINQELQDKVFDPDGYFTDKIRPLSIDTSLITVGAKSQQFTLLDTAFVNSKTTTEDNITWGAGRLVHFAVNRGNKNENSWSFDAGSYDFPSDDSYYIYIRADKSSTYARVLVTTDQIEADVEDSNYYHFLCGTISSVMVSEEDTQFRYISLSYGTSSINGRFIHTGCIKSNNGKTYFDLDKGEIGGTIKFTQGETQSDLGTVLEGLLDGLGEVEDKFDNLGVGGTNLAIEHTASLQNCELVNHVYTQTKNDTKTNFALQIESYKNNVNIREEIFIDETITTTGKKIFKFTPTLDYDRIRFKHNGSTVDIGVYFTNDKFKVNQEYVLSVEFVNVTQGSFSWKNLKIEQGNIATDWTPAPEDVEQAIADAEDRTMEALADEVATINGGIDALQKQVDGEVTSWFLEGEPTLNNAPAKDWTTDELKLRHEGDTYTNINNFNVDHLKSIDLWEQGTCTGNYSTTNTYDQIKTNSTIRLRTIDIIPNAKNAKITIGKGYKIAVKYFDTNKYSVSDNVYVQSKTLDTTYPYFSLLIKKDDDSNITPEEIINIPIYIEGGFDYDPTAGQSWRWCNCNYTDESGTTISGWHWHKIADSDAVKALAEAAKAQSTADGKSTTFVIQPSNYSKGDLWILANDTTVNGTSYKAGTILTANEASATFVASHWGEKVKYTDDEVANAAQKAAEEADKKADQAQTDAANAKNRLDNWASDSVISPTEKQGIKDEIARIVADKAHIESEYTKYSLGTPTTFNTAYTAYYDVLTTLSATEPETITIPADFATKQTTYYTARTNALNAISEGAKLYAESYADAVAEFENRNWVNLLPKKYLIDLNSVSASYPNITTITEINSEKAYRINLTNWMDITNWGSSDAFQNKIQYKENTQYTLKFRAQKEATGSGMALVFCVKYVGESSKTEITSSSVYATTPTNYQFTTKENATIEYISISFGSYNITYIFNIELIEGAEIPSHWIEAYEDSQSYKDIQEAQQTADSASQAASKANDSIDEAFADGSMSRIEQKSIKTAYGELQRTKSSLDKEYLDVAFSEHLDNTSVTIDNTTYSTPQTTLTTSKSDLDDKYNAYANLVAKLVNYAFTDKFKFAVTYAELGTSAIAIDTALDNYNSAVAAYKQALSVAQENIRVNMQKTSKEYADKKVDNLQIGGVNLALYSTSKCNNALKTGNFGFKQINADTKTNFELKIDNYNNSNSYDKWSDNVIITNLGRYSYTIKTSYETSVIRIGANGSARDTIASFKLAETIPSGTQVTVSVEITNITQGSFAFKNIQVELGNKATAWEPNDADIIEARENILKEGMIVNVIDNMQLYEKELTTTLKANTEYVLSVESSTNDGYLSLVDSNANGELTTLELVSNKKNFITFTTPNYTNSKVYLNASATTLFGVKLAEGNKYTPWEGTSEEQQALITLNNAMKGTTDIIGGLVMTNLIGMKGHGTEANQIKAGISGLNENNNLRFWAGSTAWSNANSAPFRVYDDGRVFGKLFYASQQSLTLNSSHITTNANSEYFSYNNGIYCLNADNIPDTIYLDSTLVNYSIGLPKKYSKDKTIEIYNPHKLALSFLDIVPNPTYCNISNFRNNSWHPQTNASNIMPIFPTLSINGSEKGYMSYNIGVKDTSATNYKPTYIKLKNIKVTLYGQVQRLTISNTTAYYYVMYIPTWVRNNLWIKVIPNGVTTDYVNLGTSTSNTHYRLYKYIGTSLPESNNSFSLDFRVWVIETISDDYLTDKVNY